MIACVLLVTILWYIVGKRGWAVGRACECDKDGKGS